MAVADALRSVRPRKVNCCYQTPTKIDTFFNVGSYVLCKNTNHLNKTQIINVIEVVKAKTNKNFMVSEADFEFT